MSRTRLTERLAARRRKADAETPETPIDLGKNRTYHKIDDYHTFEPKLNHWTPDMRHEWKDNPREETGHGIPKNVKVYNAAKKATKLAGLLLGKNASDEAILEQAKAFMRMGDRHLTASLNRIAECECCDEAKAEEPKTACDEGKSEGTTPAVEAPKTEAPKTETACDDAAKPAPVVEAPAPEAPKTEETCVASEETEKAEKTEESKAEEPKTEEPKAEESDVDVDAAPEEGEITFSEDDATEGEAEADDLLSSALFNEDAGEEETAPAATPTTASNHKVGLKKLAGQPQLVRVASKNADELAGLWSKWENPDIR